MSTAAYDVEKGFSGSSRGQMGSKSCDEINRGGEKTSSLGVEEEGERKEGQENSRMSGPAALISKDENPMDTSMRTPLAFTSRCKKFLRGLVLNTNTQPPHSSSTTNPEPLPPPPPPDGGTQAWTQAVMGHLVIFNTWGMIATFGVFQQYYTAHLGLEPSAVSWIGSVQMLGHFSLGIFTGRLFDAGISTILPGMLLAALGMFMTSLCTRYWQFFLAQGVLNGLGNGMQFAPALSLLATYFSKHRSVAVAIMACGSATGGIAYPTIARQLLPKLGFAWTVRIMAFIMLAVGAMYCLLLRPRLPPRKSGPILELGAFKEPSYIFFCVGIFLVCLGQFFAFYYISSFAADVVGLSYSSSVTVLLVLNGIGFLGRLVPSYFADKYTGPQNILILFCFISALILYFWPLVTSEAGLYVFSVVYGFFVAGFQGTFPAALTLLTKNMSKVGTRTGQGLAFVGMGTFVGPPIAGALIQSDEGRYLIAQMFAGSAVLLGSVILVLARCSITGWKFRMRV